MSIITVSRHVLSTMAEVIDYLRSQTELSQQRQRDLISSVRLICRLLYNLAPDQVPSDARSLRMRLTTTTPGSLGLTPERWRNVKSLIGKSLQIAGATTIARRSNAPMSVSWVIALRCVKDAYTRSKLSRLARHCTHMNIQPCDLSDVVVAEFGSKLLAESLIARPKQVHRNTCVAWNGCASAIPGWPPIVLTVPNNKRVYALPVEAFAVEFQADFKAYFLQVSTPNIFDDDAPAPVSETTLRDRRILLLEIATALVNDGRSLETIRSLSDLVDVASAKRSLMYLWTRNGQRKTGQMNNFARLLVNVAQNWVHAPEPQIDQLRKLRKQVDPGKGHMTERNKRKLRAFADTTNVELLVNVPDRIFRELGTLDRPTYNDAIRAQSALAILIELVAPIRAKNLADLRTDRHVVRARSGQGAVVHLVIPAHEVKNDEPLEFELPAEVVVWMDVYETKYRPLLVNGFSPFLFPSRSGGAKPPGPLAVQIKKEILRTTGLDLNLHAFRHLCAYLFLQAHPGEYETVRSLLGHKSLATTIRFYCGLEKTAAVGRYNTLLSSYRRSA
jgi:integrase